MADKHQAIYKEITDKLKGYAEKKVPSAQRAIFVEFLSHYFKHVSIADLAARDPIDLFGAAYAHWQLLYERNKDEHKVTVINPCVELEGWQSTHSIVLIDLEDAPFLVESIRMALRDLGYSTHLIIHLGGIRILRDKKNRVVQVLPSNSTRTSACAEAPIYVEIDRQTDQTEIDRIIQRLKAVLRDVCYAVNDWPIMQKELNSAIESIKKIPLKTLDKAEAKEAIEFLDWLSKDHFTFLGCRKYEVIEESKEKVLRLIQGSSAGVLRDESKSRIIRYYSELPEEARDLALSPKILIITQTNTRSTVHRPVNTACIIVKYFDKKGKVLGEWRFIGLYTSDAYNRNPQKVPFLRHKVAAIIARSGLPARSHASRRLLNILETFPRDDLFQGTIEELERIAMGILQMQDRGLTRLFVRKDVFHRYISCFVYVPRDNCNTDLIMDMQHVLMDAFHGQEVDFTMYFPQSIQARIHYFIRIDPLYPLTYDVDDIERRLIEVGRTWQDGLREHLLKHFGEEQGIKLFNKYRRAFPLGYQEVFTPEVGVRDIKRIESLSSSRLLEMTFYRPLGADPSTISFKLFCPEFTVPLSDALPMLENMGLRVIGEQPYELSFRDGSTVWINDFIMSYGESAQVNVEDIRETFQNAFYRIWHGDAQNDRFNCLVLAAQLTWREISVLRAYAKYLRQTGFTFSQAYIEAAFTANPSVAHMLIDLFHLRFDPSKQVLAHEAIPLLESKIINALEQITSLDEDRILRRYLELIKGTLRTNFYQKTKQNAHKSYVSFKFSSAKIPDLPEPKPLYEIFVYSPRLEGIHLRFDSVARGGLRWSDRKEDFRTEVLGLVKAQQVKNAVIVPWGAKGGFVTKCVPPGATRDEIQQEGIRCYKNFIRGLLDLTDNYQGGAVVPPELTVRYDEDDPYLVVAADKGTATFSDTANAIAKEYDFWLGDAFASGGCTGYDHKKMGITARGAWVAVQRHFQEMGKDPQKEDFTVVGIGDMSGDVFGNGMLLSEHIQLVAAFNHMHIFLDPAPDAKRSFVERKRLFNQPRSTWEDYNQKLISKGGGVYRRSAKFIRLSPEVKALLEVHHDVMEPNELIRTILKAPVDLLWNGGIGTFVKAISESNDEVGDRVNDNLRINGCELRAKVVGEGGNLGCTQRARIEYALQGGRLNTDFIDNSAGVDCSDHEVNIKILLNTVMQSGDLTEKQRNQLLADMTGEVSDLVLKNNYEQNRLISLAVKHVKDYFRLYWGFIQHLERKEKLNRALEYLPEDETLQERFAAGQGLTRPELSILLAYSKILLNEELLASELPEDDYFKEHIKKAFPERLSASFAKQMHEHPLRREIVVTQLSNDLTSDMGLTFCYQMKDETGLSTFEVVRAYVVTREIFGLTSFWEEMRRLDHKINPELQRNIMLSNVQLLRRCVRWFLRNQRVDHDISKTVAHFSKHIDNFYSFLPEVLIGSERDFYEERLNALIKEGLPQTLAQKVASTRALSSVLNVVDVATEANTSLREAAQVYLRLMDRLGLVWLREQINDYPVDSHWSVLARSSIKGDMDRLQRRLTHKVLKFGDLAKQPDERVEQWMLHCKSAYERWQLILTELKTVTAWEFTMLSVALRELVLLASVEQK